MGGYGTMHTRKQGSPMKIFFLRFLFQVSPMQRSPINVVDSMCHLPVAVLDNRDTMGGCGPKNAYRDIS